MKVFTLVLVSLLTAGMSLMATDVQKLFNAKEGIYDIQYKNGVIVSFTVIGKQNIPENLRQVPGRAAEFSRDRAQKRAHNCVTIFLNTKCTWVKVSNGKLAVRETSAGKIPAGMVVVNLTPQQKNAEIQKCISMLLNRCSGKDDNNNYVWVGYWNLEAYADYKSSK